MAVALCISQTVRLVCKRLQLPQQETRNLSSFWRYGPFAVSEGSRQLSLSSGAYIHIGKEHCAPAPTITVTEEPDTLYQKVEVVVKGHDRAVLDSYEFFATTAAKELGISISKLCEPKKKIERLTVLKSVHIHKNHRVQYEMRTHYRNFEFLRLTGSTAQVFLEYLQRNLPEGVAMEVTKTAIEKVPEHILEPLWNSIPQKEESSQ